MGALKYSVIIPCYNEENNIQELVHLLEQSGVGYDMEWVMVENGSVDGTRSKLDEACGGKKLFRIVYVNKNKGYGYGLQQGLKAATGDYVGWIHADMQIAPSEIVKFIRIAGENPGKLLFLKGRRKNRGVMDYFFTGCMTVYASLMLKTWIYDIGGIPVLFNRELLGRMPKMPYDFSVETYVYAMAKKNHYEIHRYNVVQKEREKGSSSWNRGLCSKIRQSRLIIKDIAIIRKGEQVK